MKTRPKLKFWQIWNMSFGFLGIQFGFALQNANTSRIFESLGAEVEQIPILWIAAPVTGLLIQPIIGHLSDKTWTKLGRRKPFFLIGAVLASLALVLMPNSPNLWIAAGMLWIMDASINITMEPFRAFVGDLLPSEQRTMGFTMQSFFIGIGSVLGSALPYLFSKFSTLSSESTAEIPIPPTVQWSFYLGGFAFLVAVLITVFTTKEYPPEVMKEFEAQEKSGRVSNEEEVDSSHKSVNPTAFLKFSLLFLFIGVLISFFVWQFSGSKEIYVLGGLMLFFSLAFALTALFKKRKRENGISEIMTDLVKMPKTMGQLAVVQFFTWLAFFSMWIYTTKAVTDFHYHTTDHLSEAYNTGADWVGVLFGAYNLFAAMVAFLLPVLAKYVSRRGTHLISLFLGGLGLMSLYIIKDPTWLLLSMFGVGVAWASTLSMPYAMLTGALPSAKMGTYMGIFNFFIVLPQIMAATILGAVTKFVFDGHAIYTLIFGGISMIIAGLLCLIVVDDDDPYFIKKRAKKQLKMKII